MYPMMNPRLSRNELWILLSVLSVKMPLSALLHSDEPPCWSFSGIWNCQHHGMTQLEALATIHGLAASGLIEFESRERREATASESLSAFMSFLGDHRDDYCQHSPLYYRLTEQGGSVYESFVRPQWDRFYTFSERFGGPSTESIEFVSASRDAALGVAAKVTESLCRPSPKIEVLDPWQALYWKSLPLGFQLAMEVSDDHPLSSLSDAFNDAIDAVIGDSRRPTVDTWP
jgi:hypothetical protein